MRFPKFLRFLRHPKSGPFVNPLSSRIEQAVGKVQFRSLLSASFRQADRHQGIATSAEDKKIALSVVEVDSLAAILSVQVNDKGNIPGHMDVFSKEKKDE
ncbi:MAG: hypothetical protein V4512_16210 [Pseudomonadota bacterium]